MYDDDPVNVYMSVLRSLPPMTPEREAECARHIRAGNKESEVAEKDLVESGLLLVVEIARKHPSDRIHILDLVQIGNQALLSAVRAFVDSNAQDLATFATPYIENAIAHRVATAS